MPSGASVDHQTDLVLMDSPLSIPSINMRETGKITTHPPLAKDPYNRPEWSGFDAYDTLMRTFEYFSPREVLKLMSTKVLPDARSGDIFHCLLVVSDWQFFVEELERKLRNLQSRATESLDRTMLKEMGAFRRILAAARETIADNEAQMLLTTGMATKINIGGMVSCMRLLRLNYTRTCSVLTWNRNPKITAAYIIRFIM